MLCPAALALVAVLSCCGASPISKGSNGTNLEDRGIQPPCIASQYLATPIDNNAPGDGDPHQNYYHIQLSDNINCEGGSCQTSESNTDSKTIGFTIGTNSNAKKLGWFQGGFSVSETWTTGNAYTCDGTAGEIVCVWQNVAHTAVNQQSALLVARLLSLSTVHRCGRKYGVWCVTDPKPALRNEVAKHRKCGRWLLLRTWRYRLQEQGGGLLG